MPPALGDVAGTEFDPYLEAGTIRSGILSKSVAKDIRPVKDCLARALHECRGDHRSLMRTCAWIRVFHLGASANGTWANNNQFRRL
jgi:hypothetical protein